MKNNGEFTSELTDELTGKLTDESTSASVMYYNVLRENAGSSRYVHLDEDLDERVELYLKQNSLKFSELIRAALGEYITRQGTLKQANTRLLSAVNI